jgi:hypothetical protein
MGDALWAYFEEQGCWGAPVDATRTEDLVVRVRIQLRRDGKLAAPPQVLDGALSSDNSSMRAAAQSARAAVILCAPYSFLPADQYETWRDIVFTFDPRLAAELPPDLTITCKLTDPLLKTFGGTQWFVYACDDGQSLIVKSEPSNPASPFFFTLIWEGAGWHKIGPFVHGEGSGSKASDAAHEDLAKLTIPDIKALYEEVRAARQSPAAHP